MNIFHGENKSIPLVPDGAVLVDIDGDNDDDIMYLASNSSSSTLFILTQLENTGNSSDAVFSNSERHFFGWKKEGVPEGASTGSSILFVDEDGDGDKDLFIFFADFCRKSSIRLSFLPKHRKRNKSTVC